MVKLNGQSLPLAGKVLADYLAEKNYDPARVAVELNGEIVPRTEYARTIFCDGDAVEVVCFVGGG